MCLVIHRAGSNWLLEDGGSIYVLGPQFRSQIVTKHAAASCPSAACLCRPQLANYVSHQQKLFGALYTDEGSAYWRLTYWRACSPC